ncbi:uncharacterized protein LOC124153008 [Haliotis rufescens]|uniref:uncharacterized protein LOC124153008 n=1 Tax=Haliotis rufescens TaxID=6454 RepID=UPI001EAFB41D|nr:uncharacterized protein LOC124153008 [Haliotis rufescens]
MNFHQLAVIGLLVGHVICTNSRDGGIAVEPHFPTTTATTAPTTTTTPPPPVCEDKLSTCSIYKSVCESDTQQRWALLYCAKTCRLCNETTVAVTRPTRAFTGATVRHTLPATCVDKWSNCDFYPHSCAPVYKDWASANCARFCNLC